MQPKVTIILPVYNVEPYLRQCLDSVVNQTMQEIQIICVNDGSTDGSPAILEAYAEKDSRIEVIHQENQGGGSARNAAYPYIKGKYTYFVDPDDWIGLDLCRQCFDRAEATEADAITIQHIVVRNYSSRCSRPFDTSLPEIRQTPEEKYEMLRFGAPWRLFWLSDFLLSNNIRFSEGKRPYNDVFQSWKGCVLANRIAILNEPLYYHRTDRLDSYQYTKSARHFILVETRKEIEIMLHETGLYETYKEFFLTKNAAEYMRLYRALPCSLRFHFLQHVRKSITESDREFYQSSSKILMTKCIRTFCEMMIDDKKFALWKYHFFDFPNLLERVCRKWVIIPLKNKLQIGAK